MAPDGFTEITSESWTSRIGGAIKGIVVGIVLFVASFPLLFWNEGRAVSDRQSLAAGAASTVTADPAKVDPANEGKPVYLTGRAETKESLSDEAFGIAVQALRLVRTVEMFQWIEKKESTTEKKVGGGTETRTTYKYVKDWSEKEINPAEFKQPKDHVNPARPFASLTKTASQVTVGAFQLPADMTAKLSNYTPLPVTQSNLDKLPADVRGRARLTDKGLYISISAAGPGATPQPATGPEAASLPAATAAGGPGETRVGDVRVTFKAVLPCEVSLVARQVGNSFAAYVPKPGGLAIEMISAGSKSAAQLYSEEQASRDLLTWVLRLVGFLAMGIGLALVCRPLSVVADVIPFVGNIVGGVSGFLSFLIALPLTLIVISIAWVFYRPMVGIPILIVGVAGVVGAFVLKSKNAKAKRLAPAPP